MHRWDITRRKNDDRSVEGGTWQCAKTIFLALWGCAVESMKRNPLLFDETVLNIIEQVDYDFSKMEQNLNPLTMIAWIKRILICDRVVRRFLSTYSEGTIVNIGVVWKQPSSGWIMEN